MMGMHPAFIDFEKRQDPSKAGRIRRKVEQEGSVLGPGNRT